MAEVTSKILRTTSPTAECDRDGVGGTPHHFVCEGLGVAADRHAATDDLDVVDGDRRAIRVELHARTTCCREDATPVRVLAEDRGLHQRRRRDRPGDGSSVHVRWRSTHDDGHEMFCAFPVGDDRPGIVAAFTGALLPIHANLEDSAMTLLEGQFAIVLVVAAGGVDSAAVRAALAPTATSLGLTLDVRLLDSRSHEPTGA